MQQSLKVLEYINIAITIFFLLAYLYRLCHLRHFAITQQYKSKYPWPRIIFCSTYAVLSVAFLIMSIVLSLPLGNGDSDANSEQFWIIQFGVGEVVDSVILVFQLFVLRQELNKERPYTPIHLIFCIYLTFISVLRLIFVLFVIFKYNMNSAFPFFGFYLAFLINSVLLLGYWIAKRQQLPQFQKHNYFNFDQLNNLNNTRNIMHRNIEISQLRKTSQNFNYIRPTVSVEKGQFRIVLQTPKQNDDIETDKLTVTQTQNRSTRKIGFRKKYSIISNSLYSQSQILQLYKLCGRFTLSHNLPLSSSLPQLYPHLQPYLQQLFSCKKHYLKPILSFFSIPQQQISSYQLSLRNTFKQSDMDIYANMDRNAAFVSVRVFKQLWIDQYYLFYMDVVTVDGRFEARPMRRYNDFQMFHHLITNIVRRKYQGKYVLPSLPKKYLFNWDQGKITQRRCELQMYLRSLTNDYKFMQQLHQVREATLEFLGFYQVVGLDPVNQIFVNFYKNIEVFKGSISKQFISSQYVTFYQFKILHNGIPIRSFKKRFSDFVSLHQSIQRWMTNTQISYKFITLPQKHLYKSGDRHEKLRNYLQTLTKVPQIWKVYEVNLFFHVGNNSMKDISMSRIEVKDQHSPSSKKFGINEDDDIQTQRFIDQESISSKGRMSALIEELGSNY